MTISAMPDRLRVNGDGASLLGVRCLDCGASFFGTAEHCRRCTSARLEPVDLGTEAELHSWTVVYRAAADWTGPVPYALAEAVLPAGVVVISRLVDWQEGEQPSIGSRLVLATELVGEDEDGNESAIYTWRRA